MVFSAAFQRDAFQSDAFQIGSRTDVTGTTVLQKPVDYYMVGLPQYRESGRTYEPSKGRTGETVKLARGNGGRLQGPAPSFTTTTTKRGYD